MSQKEITTLLSQEIAKESNCLYEMLSVGSRSGVKIHILTGLSVCELTIQQQIFVLSIIHLLTTKKITISTTGETFGDITIVENVEEKVFVQ